MVRWLPLEPGPIIAATDLARSLARRRTPTRDLSTWVSTPLHSRPSKWTLTMCIPPAPARATPPPDHALHALTQVLSEIGADSQLERFRLEYETLYRALKKSHESEKRECSGTHPPPLKTLKRPFGSG